MGRLTRTKAAEMHIHEDFAIDTEDDHKSSHMMAAPENQQRMPLAEIEANSGGSHTDEYNQNDLKQSTRRRKAPKKGAKRNDHIGINDDATETPSLSRPGTPQQPAEVVPDILDSVPSPASIAASDDLIRADPERVRDVVEQSHLPVHDIRPNSPPSKAVRLTRSQLRNAATELECSESQRPKNDDTLSLRMNADHTVTETLERGAPLPNTENTEVPARVNELGQTRNPATALEAMPNTLQNTRADSPQELSSFSEGKDVPAHKDDIGELMVSSLSASAYDQLEAAAIQAQTPPRPSDMSAFEDPITALDEIDDAVEKINAEVPDVQTSPQKPRPKAHPPVRATKASQARISLAHGPKDPQRRTSSWGKPPTQLVNQRVTSTSSDNSNVGASDRKSIEIPHSKPRPMSMSFPAPPPPPKSTKAPTTSNFQLPGEAVAAKFKAAREARLQKEADEQKKRAFKARPAPTMTKAPAVRQTSTSKARETLMNGKPLSPTNSPERASSVAAIRPSTTTRPRAAKPSTTSTAKPASNGTSTAPASTVRSVKRPSTAMSLSNKSRPASTVPEPTTLSTSRPPSAAQRPLSSIGKPRANGTSKGKEVFNRAAQAKAAAEKEKREKEEAAKKARAEAAERSRQLSREWAEKQRLKKLGIKPENKANEDVVAVGDEALVHGEELAQPAEEV